MQKHRFFQYLVICLLTLVQLLQAQPERWYQLYVHQDILTLKQALDNHEIQNKYWRKFVETLFVEEIEDVLPAYMKIYESTTDPLLKKVVLDRVSQYYYAKGFYDTATRILEDAQFRSQLFYIKQDQIHFGVQLGAFSNYKNALNAKTRFEEKISEIQILSKQRNGKKLYIVVSGRFADKRSAEAYLQKLKRDYRIKGIIVQY